MLVVDKSYHETHEHHAIHRQNRSVTTQTLARKTGFKFIETLK